MDHVRPPMTSEQVDVARILVGLGAQKKTLLHPWISVCLIVFPPCETFICIQKSEKHDVRTRIQASIHKSRVPPKDRIQSSFGTRVLCSFGTRDLSSFGNGVISPFGTKKHIRYTYHSVKQNPSCAFGNHIHSVIKNHSAKEYIPNSV